MNTCIQIEKVMYKATNTHAYMPAPPPSPNSQLGYCTRLFMMHRLLVQVVQYESDMNSHLNYQTAFRSSGGLTVSKGNH